MKGDIVIHIVNVRTSYLIYHCVFITVCYSQDEHDIITLLSNLLLCNIHCLIGLDDRINGVSKKGINLIRDYGYVM